MQNIACVVNQDESDHNYVSSMLIFIACSNGIYIGMEIPLMVNLLLVQTLE